MTVPNRFRFRAWDEVNKRMEYPTEMRFREGYPIDMRSEAHRMIWLRDETPLMQSTGLLDKKGVEIFEGDLFRYTNERGESAVLEVVWFEHGWHGALPECKNDREYDYEIPLWNIPKEYEVIGNIYQSPKPART